MSWQDTKSETWILYCSILNLVVSQETGLLDMCYAMAEQIRLVARLILTIN